jgi:hypothetical protein
MKLRLTASCIDNLIEYAQRTPYTPIPESGPEAGSYMERFWILPYDRPSQTGENDGCGPLSFLDRPFGRLLQLAGISIRLHHIKRSDAADAFHDHPASYIALILRGGYREIRPILSDNGVYGGEDWSWYETGQVLFRSAKSLHRLELPYGHDAWTLFMMFPETNEWGFRPVMIDGDDLFLRSKLYASEFFRRHEARQ